MHCGRTKICTELSFSIRSAASNLYETTVLPEGHLNKL
ncbi:hypothetical protein BD94_2724 [Elizabethkingia anophelis NUHP1]|uniref:Uncharacterized protein n=1 Tax=Elizabethkingia anophelis NUHP1 TaxID=1338011 RepID=A0A077EJW1_9FLAO|nr:hypothetical protein BD94_2724 [Elizabethkingia anophelis NUHP1]